MSSLDAPRAAFSPLAYILLPDALLCLALAFDLPLLARVLVFGVQSALFAMALCTTTTTDPGTDYLNGFLISSLLLLSMQYLLLRDPWRDARYERGAIAGAPADMTLPTRLWWAVCLVHNVRGIGWAHQVRNVPPRTPMSRPRFLLHALRRVLADFLLADALNVYTRRLGFTLARIHALPWALQLTHIAAWVALTAALADAQYHALAALSVAAHLGRPEDWPPVYGSLSDAYTLRNFWGKVWHQNLRRLVSPPGQRLARALGFAPGTWQSAYTQLYTAFLLSGLVHSTGDILVAPSLAFTSLPFFLLQALGITLEDAAIALVGARRGARVLGYAWVLGWAAVTFAAYRDLAIRAGWAWSVEWPVSPVGWMLGVLEGTGAGRGTGVGAAWAPREM